MTNPSIHGYRTLRSGDLTLLYREGEIRRIFVDQTQVVSSIYVAVRDHNWGTLPVQVFEESIQENLDGFMINLMVGYGTADILFDARISILAEANQLTYIFSGSARSNFKRNRIGLCVLHPIKECKGRPLNIVHPDGSVSREIFPKTISPDQPCINIKGMKWKPANHIEAELDFEGDIFEMEDQRNWTDASYKTYSTPLEYPFPVMLMEGDSVDQTVSLVVKPLKVNTGVEETVVPSLRIQPDKLFPMPAIGIESSTDGERVSLEEAEQLKRITFDHLRVDLWLAAPQLEQNYDRAAEEQKLLGWPLELVLHFNLNYLDELDAFLEIFRQQPVKIRHILLFDRDHLSSKMLLNKVVPELKSYFPYTIIGGGTDAYFAELNRNRPDTSLLDFVTYTLCPQIHASDNLTLIENLEAQFETVKCAQSLFQKPVSIGAITLNQRFNIVATDEKSSATIYPLTDRRQKTVFAAGWTLGSIKQLAMAGASSLTFFETVGSRGLLHRDSSHGNPYPLFHLFKEWLDDNLTHIIATSSSAPFSFDGVTLHGPGENKLLLVNYLEINQGVDISIPGIKAFQTYLLAEGGWEEIQVQDLHHFPLKASAFYKIIFNE
jgi:D-apionolactonase